MGLAGPKVKQRIPNDPRNLAWSEDALKFGHVYLAKLGWSPGLGLGTDNNGRTSHIAVAQKLDQLGIGAGNRPGNDKDAIAWKQQNEFEAMLARLNNPDPKTPALGVVSALGFERANEAVPMSSKSDVTSHSSELETPVEPLKKKKKKSLKSGESSICPDDVQDNPKVVEEQETPRPIVPVPRRFAHHRSRLLNAKKITTKSATELAEVLGISSSSAPTPSNDPTPSESPGCLTPIADDMITTSNTTISDYFNKKLEKLGGMHKRSQGNPPTGDTTYYPEDAASRLGLGSRRIFPSTMDSLSNPSTSNTDSTEPTPPSVAAYTEPSTSTCEQISSTELNHSASPADVQSDSSETSLKKVKKNRKEKKRKKGKEMDRKVELAETEGEKDGCSSPVMEPSVSRGSTQKRKRGSERKGGKEEDDEERRIRKEKKKEKKRRKLE